MVDFATARVDRVRDGGTQLGSLRIREQTEIGVCTSRAR
jgi:hypothetical protein